MVQGAVRTPLKPRCPREGSSLGRSAMSPAGHANRFPDLLRLEQAAYQRWPERVGNIQQRPGALEGSDIADSPALITRAAAVIAVTVSDPNTAITRHALRKQRRSMSRPLSA